MVFCNKPGSWTSELVVESSAHEDPAVRYSFMTSLLKYQTVAKLFAVKAFKIRTKFNKYKIFKKL